MASAGTCPARKGVSAICSRTSLEAPKEVVSRHQWLRASWRIVPWIVHYRADLITRHQLRLEWHQQFTQSPLLPCRSGQPGVVVVAVKNHRHAVVKVLQ